jgi:hypothetical protein
MDQKNLDIYGNEPIPWSRPLAELEKLVANPGSTIWVAPSAGPPPWYLYEITPRTAFGVATVEPNGATRWRFTV